LATHSHDYPLFEWHTLFCFEEDRRACDLIGPTRCPATIWIVTESDRDASGKNKKISETSKQLRWNPQKSAENQHLFFFEIYF
jgi:hypothetical protein